MHGKIISSPNKEIITNAIRQNKIIDEELLRKANNKFLTPNEFNHALKDLVNRNMHFTCIKTYLTIIKNHTRAIPCQGPPELVNGNFLILKQFFTKYSLRP